MPLTVRDRTATPEEIQLVTAIRGGDEQAFMAVVERHYSAMLALAKAYVLAPETATQVVHDAWAAALAEADRFEGRTPLRPWLLRFVVSLAGPLAARTDSPSAHTAPAAVDAERFRAGDDAFPGHWRAYPRDWRTLPDDVLRGEDARRVVEAAIEALPIDQRAIVTLHDVVGCPLREACDILE